MISKAIAYITPSAHHIEYLAYDVMHLGRQIHPLSGGLAGGTFGIGLLIDSSDKATNINAPFF